MYFFILSLDSILRHFWFFHSSDEVHECLTCLLAPRKSSLFDYKSDEEYANDTQYALMQKPKKPKPTATAISSANIMQSPGRNQFGEAIEIGTQYSLNNRPSPNMLLPSVKMEKLTETMITQATIKRSPRAVTRSPSYSPSYPPAPNQRINPYAVSTDTKTSSHENVREAMREYLKKFTPEEIQAMIMANDPEMETQV